MKRVILYKREAVSLNNHHLTGSRHLTATLDHRLLSETSLVREEEKRNNWFKMATSSLVVLFVLTVSCLLMAQGSQAKSLKNNNIDCCALPPVSGRCLAYMPRYYFDPETKSCTRFIYGGCLGNCNKFISVDKCLEACKK
ncbi:unnamed protein product [Timema podura]|uniref:BPTI/Kunitz inhibitor domain-containing protein n=1 Tax=Timema podura TaxID=61482 RepID=A0ABN7PHH3_TIMPD|nr:unnamed protein product [Timema podura]